MDIVSSRHGGVLTLLTYGKFNEKKHNLQFFALFSMQIHIHVTNSVIFWQLLKVFLVIERRFSFITIL